ncbi:hypothetical protein D1B31_04855 [Neobacillus notoginsengisoli]|uniref:Uncharacterized protein n=1 Tax=Neobacillus notoginsengisoli TaxID=1578198 RepID=A0A417YWK6_9BACI|nr:hypothetical protein [Neobacillus notoginsengisoli]RHW41977.1 hypothetical protein D1B31_04855 [Neobacillus notoginsengisoli]
MVDISKNYHSRLLDMSKAFDKPIERLKGGHVDSRFTSWVVCLLLAPFRQYARIIKVHEGLKKFSAESLTALTIPSSTLLATGVNWTLGNINNLIEFVGVATIGFLAGYIFSLLIYFTYLLDFYSDHFHTGAYKVFRRQEYNMFKMALYDKEGEFYFKGVYDYVGSMQAGRAEFNDLSDKMTDYFEKDKMQLQTKYALIQNRYHRLERKSEEKINEIEGAYNSLIQDYDIIVKDLSAGAEYVIELIKHINNVLFRLRNEEFTSKDLDLVCGFTLYEQRGKELHKIEDVGTSGRTPKVLNIDEPQYQDWGVVKVVKDKMKQPVINEPYDNHTVVSVKLNIDRDKIWIYNFHFDSDNKKVNYLLVKNDIIDSREVYRLIHALCLIAERMRNSTLKEANKHA